jgi:hypothetical protein
MARALSPLVALYLVCQLTLLPFVVAERQAPVPEPPAPPAADSVLPQSPSPDSLGTSPPPLI